MRRLVQAERRVFVHSSKLTAYGAVAFALTLAATACSVFRPLPNRSPAGDAATVTKQRFLDMFARSYFPGRSGQIMIVPREGDFITRPDPDVPFMHGSPWAYDIGIPLMFACPRTVSLGTWSKCACAWNP